MKTKDPGVVLRYVLALFFIGPTFAYKHIIFMHGLFAGPSEFNTIKNWLRTEHPGTTYTLIDQFDTLSSLTNLWKQVNTIKKNVTLVMKQHPEGVHLICYSQGGLVCRGLLQTMPNHNVENFISLSSPLAGQYGTTSYLKRLFPFYMKETLYKFFYTSEGQRISIGNYWNDPHHHSLYLNNSEYLPYLNNEKFSQNSTEFKKGFLKLKNLVMVGGPDDGVVTPWQSSHFGFYNSSEAVNDMRAQRWYEEDLFGLKTLDKEKKLHTYTVPKVPHVFWYRNRKVWDCCIKQWLT